MASHLPPEITRMIFNEIMDTESGGIHCTDIVDDAGLKKKIPTILVLGNVCRQWRALASTMDCWKDMFLIAERPLTSQEKTRKVFGEIENLRLMHMFYTLDDERLRCVSSFPLSINCDVWGYRVDGGPDYAAPSVRTLTTLWTDLMDRAFIVSDNLREFRISFNDCKWLEKLRRPLYQLLTRPSIRRIFLRLNSLPEIRVDDESLEILHHFLEYLKARLPSGLHLHIELSYPINDETTMRPTITWLKTWDNSLLSEDSEHFSFICCRFVVPRPR